jgi:radical SAM superfamily enzyme YgiQ (UPF0313 family)
MKIALVHCPFDHREFSENLRVVDEEFCLAPPIVLAYVAAILEKAGHQVIIVEANALKLTKEKALALIKDFSPDIIGFRADTYWFHRVVEWATYFKQRMNVTTVVGGINISLYPQASLSYLCFDYGIAGEANESLPELLRSLEKGQGAERIKGLVYRVGNEVISNPPSERSINFDDYPFPSRHLLPNHLYSSFTSQRKNYTIILTSTGCPYECSFCAISKQPHRHRSPYNVVDEIEQCYKNFGVREVDFFSPSFFTHKRLAVEMCDEMLRRNIQIEWSCRSRVDHVDKECLEKAYLAGCRRIYYGIESSSSVVLGEIQKGIDIEQIKEAISLTRKSRISTLGFFMVGNPGDTRENILASIQFAKALQLDYVQVCRTIAKPKTRLDECVIEQTGKDYWQSYTLDQAAGINLPTPWTTLSKKELEGYIKKFYREFYFRPSYIFNRLLKARSMEELFRYVRVLIKWVLVNEINSKQ